MEKTIKNCWDCPFANRDNERGYDECNLSIFLGDQIKMNYKNWEELPEHNVHEKCPLKNNVTFEFKLYSKTTSF